MKKIDIQKIVAEEIESVLSILQKNSGKPEPVELPWEDAIASGTEQPAKIVTDPNKICKIVSIAKLAANKPPVMGQYGDKEVMLNRISKGDLGKFKMFTTSPEGNIKLLEFMKQSAVDETQMNDPETEEKLKQYFHNVELVEKLKEQLEQAKNSLGEKQAELTTMLTSVDDSVIESENFFAMISKKGYDKSNPKYKEAFEWVLTQVTAEFAALAKEMLEAKKTITKVAAQVAVGKRDMPIQEEISNKITGILNFFVNKIGIRSKNIKNILQKGKSMIFNSSLTELNTQTYANLMNKTADYPWKTFLGDKEGGEKQGRVNKLSNERFIQEFYKKFPKGKTILNTNNGNFVFSHIKFNANHTMYELGFKGENDGTMLYVSGTPDKIHFEISGIELSVDSKNGELLKSMLKYNQN